MSKSIIGVSDEVLRVLLNFDYDGNIRQLENIIEHAVVMCKGESIEIENLPPEIKSAVAENVRQKKNDMPLKDSEKHTIISCLNKNKWNTRDAARELKIHRSTLWRKMKKYNLTK